MSLFGDLRTKSFSVIPHFWAAEKITEIRRDLMSAMEQLRPAGVGKDGARSEETRRDRILWLEGDNPVRSALLNEMDELRRTFNRELYLGLRSFESHYAYYAPGGFYRRHLDRFRKDDARRVTLILYLNENWHAGDGGELRLYSEDGPVDVEPRSGTLACFLSGEVEHEVLESKAPRLSVSTWMKT